MKKNAEELMRVYGLGEKRFCRKVNEFTCGTPQTTMGVHPFP